MSSAVTLEEWPWGVTPPPSAAELPTEDGEPMETFRHRQQGELLIQPLRRHWRDRDDVFVGGNMFLYYSALQARRNDFRGPDVFVVVGVPAGERQAWIIWEEDGRAPDLVIELTSDSTRREDHGRKKTIYERVLRVPEYIIHDPFSGELVGFRSGEQGYQPIPPDEHGRLPLKELPLLLGPWSGVYDGVQAPWLRWYLPDGTLLPTAEEDAARASKRADREAQARAAAEAQVAELIRRLAELEGRGTRNEERGTRNEERGTRNEG